MGFQVAASINKANFTNVPSGTFREIRFTVMPLKSGLFRFCPEESRAHDVYEKDAGAGVAGA
jgi:hypothetical protein